MMRLESDLASHCLAACKGRLPGESVTWSSDATIGVVLASEHYPSSSPTGLPITGLGIEPQGVKVFHAGTKTADNATVTAGGRVLCVTARGASLADAATAAYQAIDPIQWEGMKYRSDIGWRALAR